MKLRLVGWMVAAAASGCMQSAAQVAPAEAPAIPISKPIVRDVTDYLDFTGRTSAIEAVDLVPRHDRLSRVAVLSKKGRKSRRVICCSKSIKRPYQAQLDQAEGQVKLYQAQLELARKTTLAHDQECSKTPAGRASSDSTRTKPCWRKPRRRWPKHFKLARKSTNPIGSFTEVLAPITGQIDGVSHFGAGNLVNQDQTLLATIVSLDPIYVNFDIDEPTLLRKYAEP